MGPKKAVPAPPWDAGTGRAGRAGSDRADRVGLRTLRALARFEGDALVLLEGAEAVRLDGRVVDEDVRTVVVGGDEAEALLGVEPLDGALRHTCSPYVKRTLPTVCRPGAARDHRRTKSGVPSNACEAHRHSPRTLHNDRGRHDCNRRRTYHGDPVARRLDREPVGVCSGGSPL